MTEHLQDHTDAELRALAAAPSPQEAAAAELARRARVASEQREADGRAAAEKRLVAIHRAHGGRRTALDSAAARVQQAVVALVDCINEMNLHDEKLRLSEAEAAALADRFAIPAPPLPAVPPPARRGVDLTLPGLADYSRIRPQVESDEHRLRTRRTYDEILGTDGHDIIRAAGLKPLPPLTERQQALLAERVAERRVDPTLAQAAQEVAGIPASVPVATAAVHRG